MWLSFKLQCQRLDISSDTEIIYVTVRHSDSFLF